MVVRRSFSREELEGLSGEVLPERVLMSVVVPPPMRGHRIEVFYACQTTHQEATPGLLGTGLLAQGARTSMTCVPAVVRTF